MCNNHAKKGFPFGAVAGFQDGTGYPLATVKINLTYSIITKPASLQV
ncbi:hypothetical protein ACFQ3S_17520 [Mucilaginibacter terrae]